MKKKLLVMLLFAAVFSHTFSACTYASATLEPPSLATTIQIMPEVTPTPAAESTSTPAPAPTTTFGDVPANHWACDNIESAFAKGIINGTGNQKFDPGSTLTYAQVAQIMFNAYGGNGLTDEAIKVADVPANVWYTKPVTWLLQYDLAEPRDGKFYPNDPAPRWWFTEILYKTAKTMGVELPKSKEAITFPDMTGDYAVYTEAVTALQQAGIIGGFSDGTFGPGQTLTRCQMAKMIDLYTDIVGLEPGTNMPKPIPTPAPTLEPTSTPPPATETPTPAPQPATETPATTPEPSGGFLSKDIYDELKPYAESLGYSCDSFRDPTNNAWNITFDKSLTLVSIALFQGNDYWSGVAYETYGQGSPEKISLHSIDEIKSLLDRYAN